VAVFDFYTTPACVCADDLAFPSYNPPVLESQAQREKTMSKKDGVLIASRTLALLLTVWALAEVSYLPECIFSFVHFLPANQHSSHYYLIRLSFLVVRIVGYSLLARWLYQGGPEVAESLSPSSAEENVS
jgi:hypothetical protein